ncbi:hypothetical protein [Chroococcus sp. FPU101]|uniref:hypothetical protein n=1 Tax=Chroococcus sp. FPU101 TaxID=1974212 RepID=UPI001A8C8449|nr:hypothetical protein [Chroococcus sp. FPU101]GFE71690.1 hypothetical protein CFPU101_43000 [Chroococcus sp. FPU101]
MNEYKKPISPSEELQENETQSKVIAERPAHIKENHWREWVEDSKVDPLITALNVRSLSGTTPHEYLLYGLPDSERRNDGRLRDYWLRRYGHLDYGGWCVAQLTP